MHDAYAKLTAALRQTAYLSETAGLLSWDEQVNLPDGAADFRAAQNAALAEATHAAATRPEIGEWLTALEQETLDADAACVVRETRRDYDRVVKLPTEFVRRKSEAASQGYHAWKHARAEGNFAAFAPHLERQLDLAREEADFLGRGDAPYDCAIDHFDPGMDSAAFAALFAELRDPLKELAEAVLAVADPADALLKGFPEDRQEAFLRRVLVAMGFDFAHGRIDTAVHPFCGGSGWDVRLTTRYDADNPLDSLFSAIHEAGHGLYEQGLARGNPDSFGLPLATAVGMGVHESQSRLWENQVARGAAFWAHFEPQFRADFPLQLAAIDTPTLMRAFRAVQRQPIRVDADELTYNLHVILRFELERALFAGDLAVNDLPAAWNALSEDLLGLTPASDAEGCLQDVHWSEGLFGYFPSYALGNVLAAQLWAAVHRDLPDLDAAFAVGNFAPLREWLVERVHRHGKRFGTRELAHRATGEELSSRYLLDYLSERYRPLYGI